MFLYIFVFFYLDFCFCHVLHYMYHRIYFVLYCSHHRIKTEHKHILQTFAVFHSTIQVCHRCSHIDKIVLNVVHQYLNLKQYRRTILVKYGIINLKIKTIFQHKNTYSGTFTISMTKYPFTLLPHSFSHLTSMSDLVFVFKKDTLHS